MKFLLLILLFTISSAHSEQMISKLKVKQLYIDGTIDVESTVNGSAPCPVMTESERDLTLDQWEGKCVFNSDTLKLNVFNGTIWEAVGGGEKIPFDDLPSIKPLVQFDFTTATAIDERISVNRSSSATTINNRGYVVTIPPNKGRVDFDPLTHEPKGLLVEEPRMNLVIRNIEFAYLDWTSYNASAIEGYKSPDEFPSASALTEDSSTGDHFIFQPMSFSASKDYAVSLFVRKGQYDARNIVFTVPASGFGVETGVIVNPETGAIVSSVGSPTLVKVDKFIGGWFRVSFVATTTTATYDNFMIKLAMGTAISYTGDGYSDAIIWGAQVEEGSFPTSVIITSDHAYQRETEIVRVINSDKFSSMYDKYSGTLVVDVAPRQTSDQVYVAGFSESSALYESIDIVKSTLGNYNLKTTYFGSPVADIDSLVTATTRDITALSFDKGKYRISVNGSTPIEEDSVDVNSVFRIEQMTLGANGYGMYPLNGHIRNVKYYRENFSNEKLSSLTNRGIVNHMESVYSLLPDGILRYETDALYNLVNTNPPSDGALIYNTTEKSYSFYNGSGLVGLGGSLSTPASSGQKYAMFSFTVGLYGGKCSSYYCDFSQNGSLVSYVIQNSAGNYNVYVNKYFSNVKCTASATTDSVGYDILGVDDYGGYFTIFGFNAGVASDFGATFLCHALL